MKLYELADELGVRSLVVVEQARRLGVDATWAGAELGDMDVERIRAAVTALGPAAGASADSPPTARPETARTDLSAPAHRPTTRPGPAELAEATVWQ